MKVLVVVVFCAASCLAQTCQHDHSEHEKEVAHIEKDGHEDHDDEVAHAEHDDHSGEKNDDHKDEDAHVDHSDEDEHDEHDDEAAHAEHDGHSSEMKEEEEGVLEISPEMAKKIGLKTAKATNGEIHQFITLPAEIQLNRDKLASVSPRYASTVRQVFVEIGDAVRKNDVLASLENRSTLSVYTLSAPLNGTVISKNVSVGESIEEGINIFEIADLTSVWANISVFPKYLHNVKKGQDVVFIAGDGHEMSGTIHYVSPLISEETRTFIARCILEKPDVDFMPGTFIRARINTTNMTVAVRIEREAIQYFGGESIVFTKDAHGYETKVVKTGALDSKFIEIVAGLEPGETYVKKGAFTLKAELVTSGMDPHAGHGH